MLSVPLRTLRAHWASALSSALGLALGVALMTMMGLVLVATVAHPDLAPRRYADAPVVVKPVGELRVPTPDGMRVQQLADPPGIAPELAGRLTTVGRVVVDRSFPLPDNQIGHPWAAAGFTPYRLVAGHAPGSDREIVVAQGIAAPGQRVTIGTTLYTVAGVTGPEPFERAVFFTEAEAARLDPRIDALVVYCPVDEVTRVVGTEAKVITGAGRRAIDPDAGREEQSAVSAESLLGTASGIAAFVSAFLVASTFAFAVSQRRREFALLRVVGASPGQVSRMIFAEAAVIGVVASGAGSSAGWFAAPRLAGWLVDRRLAPSWLTVGGSPWPVVAAVVTGLTMTLLGVSAAARQAGSVPPLDAIREASVERRGLPAIRGFLGIAMVVIAGIMIVTPLVSDPGAALKRKQYLPLIMVLLVAFALLAPKLVPPVARVLTWPLTWLRGAVGLVARETALAATRRTATAAAPVLMTVGLAACVLGTTATIEQTKAVETADRFQADLVVTPKATSGLDHSLVARARAMPGVEVAAEYPATVYDIDDGALIRHHVTAVDANAMADRMLNLPVVAGSLRDLNDDTIVVDGEWDRRVGDRVDVWLGDGRKTTLTVAAVISTGASGNGAYVTSKHAGRALAERLLVRAGPSPVSVAGALNGPGVTVAPGADRPAVTSGSGGEASRAGLWILLGIALVYSGLSVSGTLAMATKERSGELSMLRLSGATDGQILRIVAMDSIMTATLGIVLATAAAAITLAGLGAALGRLGATPSITVPWGTVGVIAGVCVVLAVLSSVLPAVAVLRRGKPPVLRLA